MIEVQWVQLVQLASMVNQVIQALKAKGVEKVLKDNEYEISFFFISTILHLLYLNFFLPG